MTLTKTIALSLSALSLLIGCGGSTSSFEGKDAACEDYCNSLHTCDATVDIAKCTTSCTDTKAVSKGGQEVISACLAEAGCDQANALRLADCIDDGLAKLELTGDAEKVCGETLPALSTMCHSEPTLESDCLQAVPVLSDEFLQDVNDCGSSTSCTNFQVCVASAFLTNIDLTELESGGFGGPLGEALGGLVGGGLPGGVPDGSAGASSN